MRYIPITQADKAAMLRDIGVSSTEELFAANIPADVRLPRPLNLPPALTEMEILTHVRDLTKANADLTEYTCFLGGGAYDHYIPSAVDTFLSRGEFLTAYTPYQPEISQGVLQVIYEYQSMVCELTGMDLSNASMYDGASAMAEAAGMVVAQTGRKKVVIAASVHPNYRRVVKTYMHGIGVEVIEAPLDHCELDLNKLEALITDEVAGFIVQQPNFLGHVEQVRAIEQMVHAKGGLYVVCADPISLALLEAPGNYGADIVVAEGQALGNAPSFGGPYLGLMATREKFARRIPGRIVGGTVDTRGQRSFVLTLQAREQHIRREKATSNICSNQALNALAATVYLTLVGKEGLREVACLSAQKAHYAAAQIAKLPGYKIACKSAFFKEFTVNCPQPVDQINRQLLGKKILGGIPSSVDYPHLHNAMTIAVTEKRTKAEIDALVAALGEVK
ncbi:MAG TPA: aminomethyl-transferring glycine dehydrogenase subunit GcvPA [Symbiobacteriaceae bacterium]|nr:aminomethyl-transferring glycine dehydrogenase subunit GcvPA [Symbiobacteriaceae bacterium]